jgi:hypothetical protein
MALELGCQHGVAEADAEEGGDALGRQVEKLADALVAAVGFGDRRSEVFEGAGAVGGGGEGDGAGRAGLDGPVVGHALQRRVVGHGEQGVAAGLLVVVRRADAGQRGGQGQRGGVPQSGVAVEEGGDLLVAQVEGRFGGQAVGAEQDRLARVHAVDLANCRAKSRGGDDPSRCP